MIQTPAHFIYVSTKGMSNLRQQLAQKEQEYAQVREHRQVAFEMSGDGWHDNPEFNRMQQLEASINHTVKTLSDRLQMARLIEIDDAIRNTAYVAIGSIVQLVRHGLDYEEQISETWEIVGYDETDLTQRQLAYNAPLAAAVLELKVGEFSEEITLGGKVWEIEIVALHSCWNMAKA